MTHSVRMRGMLILLIWLGLAVAPAAAQQSKPNILWITAEDISPNLGSFGDTYAVTPNLDRLASTGLRYTQFYATAPVCSPARSALINGVYATSTGTQNLRSLLPIPDTFLGFPTLLRAQGYYTANHGKTDYNTSREAAIIASSWSAQGSQAHWRGRAAGQPFFAVFNIIQSHQSYSGTNSQEFFETEVGRFLKPDERHDPAAAPVPPYYPDTPTIRRALARYHDCVTAMDKEVGRILAELEADGLTDDTIVFFYGDNGAGIPRGKQMLYDTGMLEPLIVRFPKKYQHLAPAAPGETVDRLVDFADVAPAILNLLGLSIPAYMQGQPFLGPSTIPPRTHVNGARDRIDEAYALARSVRDDRYLYIRNYMPHLSWNQPEGYSDAAESKQEITRLAAEGKLNAAQLTYAGPSRPLEELYDTRTDPFQVNNLAALPEHKTRLESMRALQLQWIMETRDVGFLPEPEVIAQLTGDTPYDLARNDTRYPLARVVAAADLVGRPEAVPQQIQLLADSYAGVRYWAAVGLNAAGAAAAPARDALLLALKDSSVTVRIEVAGALAKLGETQAALNMLNTALSTTDRIVLLHAARTLELMGDAARPSLSVMEQVLTAVRKLGNPDEYASYIDYSLSAAIRKLGAGI